MGTVELKNVIAQYMRNADDKVLKIVKTVFETYQKNTKADFFDELPKEIQELLLESRDDIKKGNYITNEEMVAEVKEKYNISE